LPATMASKAPTMPAYRPVPRARARRGGPHDPPRLPRDRELQVATVATSPAGRRGRASARSLSARNADPEGARRPFDEDHDGLLRGGEVGAVVPEVHEGTRGRDPDVHAKVGQGRGFRDEFRRLPQDGAIRARQRRARSPGPAGRSSRPAGVGLQRRPGTSDPGRHFCLVERLRREQRDARLSAHLACRASWHRGSARGKAASLAPRGGAAGSPGVPRVLARTDRNRPTDLAFPDHPLRPQSDRCGY